MSGEIEPAGDKEPWDREPTEEEMAEAAARWPDKSAAQQRHYMRLAWRAEYLHSIEAQDGTGRRAFGGPQPNSGRKPRVRLGEALVDWASDPTTQKKVKDAFEAGLEDKDNPGVRVRAASQLVKAVQGEEATELRRQELQREIDKAPLDDIKQIVAENLLKQIASGEIDLQALIGTQQKVIDATVVGEEERAA